MRLRFVLLVVLLFYIWIPGFWAFNFHLDHGGSGTYISHNHLAEAFLAGKLHLLRDPDPQLLQLSDPYEPRQNYVYKWHDASVYNGKHYLYFGPVPTLLLYVPFKLLTGTTMSDTFALLFFAYGIFIWNVLILIHLKKIYFKNIPKWLFLTSIFVLGLANGATHILHRHGGIYHINIASGCFFLSGGLYWLIRSIENNTFQIKYLLFGSLFFGLCPGSRPHLFLSGIIIFFVLLKLKRDTNHFNYREKLSRLMALVLPFLVCLFLLGLYNYLRFDDFLEFGFKYQTGDLNVRKIGPLDVEGIPSSLYLYLFLPPTFHPEFPFFRATTPDMSNLYKKFYVQPVFGILCGVPFLWLLVIGYIFLRLSQKSFTSTSIRFPKLEFVLIVTSALINFIPNIVYAGCAMRFVIEFLNPLLLLTVLFWFYFYSLPVTSFRPVLNTLTIVLAVISSVIGMSVGIDTMNMHDGYRLHSIKRVFYPLSKNLTDFFLSTRR